MAKALIVYGSTTGNTETVAGMAESALEGAGVSVTRKDAADVQASGLCEGYDLILFGCSTWGADTIVLQDDFEPLYEALDATGINGKNVAVFGCGDDGYQFFCGAVDAISERVAELGGNVVDTLKINGDPEAEADEVESWAKRVAASIA